MNILILGSSGFIGNFFYNSLNLKKKVKVFGIDKVFENNNKLKHNISKFDLGNFINKKKINIIIDAIGYSGHDLSNKTLYNKSFNYNVKCKTNILKCLEKVDTKILYISLGTLYKFGNNSRIKKEYFKPVIKTLETQSKIKNIFENNLFMLKNNYVKVLVINIGSVFGDKKKIKKDSNLIDKINHCIRLNKKYDIYYHNNGKRLKNIIDINSLYLEVRKIIFKSFKQQKCSYKEINLDKYIFDLGLLKIFKNLKFIKLPIKKMVGYYYVDKTKGITIRKFLKLKNNIYN
jgi:nucleoside-diphosphate-sugar epimerase